MPSFTIEDATCVRIADSEKAILVEAPAFDKPEWVPDSCITDDSDVYKKVGSSGDLIVSEWLAEKRGWL